MRGLTGLLLLIAMAGGVWAFGYWEPRLLPVRVIEVQGELHHHSSELLQKTIGERLSGGILTANLEDLKRAAEDLAWVGKASLRRVWPDRLQVRVEEHKPAARWGRDGLVTAEGLVFHPRTGTLPAGLPTLEGDEQRSAELVSRYLKWRDDLMLAGQLIDAVAVDARGAWRLDLVSGTRLELGTDQIEQRLARFIGAVAQLEAAGQAEVVDMRYSNGFAVKWAHSAETAATSPTQPALAERKTSAVKSANGKTGARKSAKTTKTAKGTRITTAAKGTKTDKTTAATKTAKPTAVPRTSKPAAGARTGTSARKGAPVSEGSMIDRNLQAQTDRSSRSR
jgi:cell division protein FtsQ